MRKIGKMKILAWPKKCLNPYTKILYDEFERQGINVLSHRNNRMAGILYKVDIFHFHWLNSFLTQKKVVAFFATFMYMLYIKILKIKGTKIIWTLHNSINFTHDNKNKFLEGILVPYLFENVDKLIIHSKFQKEHIESRFHHKIIWIPHHNYCSIFKQKDLYGSDYFLFFGGVSPYKGIEDAISAYKKAKHNNEAIELFRIIGKTNSKEYEEKILQLIGGDLNIVFENRYVEDDELELLVKNAKAVVLPYREITNSGSLVYALSCRKQIIIKNSLLTDELFQEYPELRNTINIFSGKEQLSEMFEKNTNNDISIYNHYLEKTDVNHITLQYMKIFDQLRNL